VSLKVAGTAVQQKRFLSAIQLPPIHKKGATVMPALLWVVFWSSMMASTACLGELPQEVAPKEDETTRD
jgi:hypothetical protein